jgi:prepilin-type N-terminal cleavage/methylation domain-containing protein
MQDSAKIVSSAESKGNNGLRPRRGAASGGLKSDRELPVPRGAAAGFTLVEIVISLAIISIALVTLLTIFNRTVVTSTDSGVLTKGVMLAGGKMALAEIDGNFVPGDSEWEEDENYPRFRYKKRMTETPFETAFLLQVDVEYDGRKIVTLENYVLRK